MRNIIPKPRKDASYTIRVNTKLLPDRSLDYDQNWSNSPDVVSFLISIGSGCTNKQ